jgi:aspartyl/asparaginyl beta-hydroxylase (cupin superfamily)
MERLQRVLAGLGKTPPEILRSPLWPQQQCQIVYCPDLEAAPFHDPARFPWIRDLEAAYPKIRAELDALIEERTQLLKVSKGRHDEVVDGSWGSFGLYVHGRPVPEHHARCPETVRALDAVPERVGLASFMALAPNTHVLPHYGTSNMKLRVHLGLRVPKACAMRIGDQIRVWEEGKALVLDDSFQHEVWNAGTTARYILLLDFLHPDLRPEEKAATMELERRMQDKAWQAYAPDATAERWEAPR